MSLPARAALFTLLALLLLGVAIGVGPVAGTDDVSDDAGQFGTNTSIVIELEPDGDAHLTVQTTFELDSNDRTVSYRDLAKEFRAGETPALGLDEFELAAAHVDSRLDRGMDIEDVTRSTASEEMIANGTGQLSVSFDWINFAYVEDDVLRVDDVLRTDTGVWLNGLSENETLLMRSPDGYGVLSANVDEDYASITDNGSIRWAGPASFDEESLAVSFVGNNQTPVTPTPVDDDDDLMLWILVVTLLVLIGLFLSYILYHRGVFALPNPDSSDPDVTADAAMPAESGNSNQPVGASAPDEKASAGGVDTELLSDEERVIHLLETNGGRMKQADIVRETDWSNAKVSQLLSAMEDDGEINKLRIGRENLISFPDEDITEVNED